MPRIIFFAVVAIFCNLTFQKAHPQSHSTQEESHFMCSYYGETFDPEIRTTAPDADAKDVIQTILSVVGLRPNFEIRAANVPNAAAVILESKRFILYNRSFISNINIASGNDWAGISIIAHEIGHHLNGHTLQTGGSRPDLELEADEFSGFVMRKLGASLADAQAAMNVAASQKGSHTHPPRDERLASIATGWHNAESLEKGGVASVKKTNKKIVKPAVVRNRQAEQRAIADQYIAFDVQFDADANGKYFITVQGNLVSVEDDNLFIIGRLAESNKRGYRLMLSDKNYNYLYITAGGAIVNGSGRTVGTITTHK